MPDHPHAAGLKRRAGLPGGEQVLDHREQLLLGRVPRLQQVVVERDLVDGLNRSLRVGVRGQQNPLRLRHQLPRLHQVVRSGQPRHPLVGDQQRDLLAPCSHLPEQLEAFGARAGAHHPIPLPEAAPQVA